MKKTILTLAVAMTMVMSGCMAPMGTTTPTTNSSGDVLTSVLGAVLTNVLFGGSLFDQSSMLGQWNYNAPSAAFNMTSSLASNYSNIGINRSNTGFSFLAGNKFSAKVNGIPFSGSYTYNQQNGEIALKTATETIKGNVIRTQRGMGLMFDSKQMANILQKEGKVSNRAAVEAVSKLAKSADGARVGFELTK